MNSGRIPFKHDHYDAIVIGAGMSGLAAAIRLAMFDKKVLVLEKHSAPGGLNSFYRQGGRNYDVGLHAVTNYNEAQFKHTPLGRTLRQLRIPREELDLHPQSSSSIRFPGVQLRFSNDPALLLSEIAGRFPAAVENYVHFVAQMPSFDDIHLEQPFVSARQTLLTSLRDPLLVDMLLLPVMYYGCPSEDDMDLNQFYVIFRSIFLDGLARPRGGVRRIIQALARRLREAGGERRMQAGVRRIVTAGGKASAVELENGQLVSADFVLSSIGRVETNRLCEHADAMGDRRLSFVESCLSLRLPAKAYGLDETLCFFGKNYPWHYRVPQAAVAYDSGVLCFPGNYQIEDEESGEGLARVTLLANPQAWMSFSEVEYAHEKGRILERLPDLLQETMPMTHAGTWATEVIAHDTFTPRTIQKFTGHLQGAVYGDPVKTANGRTALDNLHLLGTDQGYLGIVGAMFSGVLTANRAVLAPSAGV